MDLFSLCLDIRPYHVDRGTPGGQQAEALAPESFLPQLLPDLREFLLQDPAAGALIRVDELTQFRSRLCLSYGILQP